MKSEEEGGCSHIEKSVGIVGIPVDFAVFPPSQFGLITLPVAEFRPRSV
jgi:hypothetical protein